MEKVFKSKVPYITYLLIAINVIFFVVPEIMVLIGQVGHIDDILSLYSVHGPSIRDGQIFRVLTGTLLHGGIMHLFFNMYALYIIGPQAESFFGKFKYLFI